MCGGWEQICKEGHDSDQHSRNAHQPQSGNSASVPSQHSSNQTVKLFNEEEDDLETLHALFSELDKEYEELIQKVYLPF